jgi:hypothetical protein
MGLPRFARKASALSAAIATAVSVGAVSALLGVCGPFTDVSDAGFCPFVLEIFTLGITTGTSPTTYDPASSVTRLQMAAFLSRSVDGVLQRGGRRALVKKFWTPQTALALGLTTLGPSDVQPSGAESDGKDIWVTLTSSGRVSRVRASDGRLLETWTGAAGAAGVTVAMGRVLVTGETGTAGQLYRIDPGQPAGAVTAVTSSIIRFPNEIAFDGGRLWTSNTNPAVSIVTPLATIPWTVTTVTIGTSGHEGIVYDGANVWLANSFPGALLKLDGNGAILQTVTVGSGPSGPVFDGTNIWVPNSEADTVSIVRAATGTVLATLTGNGIAGPHDASFDGQRVLVINFSNNVSLWKAADLSPLGSFPMPAASGPHAACSDGANFWILLRMTNQLARF